jgi:oligopeptide/dipeptide ABC transporter ATP-binding protein
VSDPVLRVEGLVTSFPAGRGARWPVVDGIDFEIAAGEVLALVGESGCGKSMTALSVLRLVPRPGRIERGAITLDGADVLSLRVREMRALRGRRAAMIFQEPMTALNPVQSVGTQIAEAILLHERASADALRKRAIELLERVRVPDPAERVDSYPHQLSGGLKQRVMIAMALALRPRLLIADEPTTALDVTIQAQVLSLLRELQRELGTAILLITHDLGVVNELSDRVAVMYAGKLVETGPRAALLSEPAHPYTRGLLRAIPARVQPGQALHEIPGVVPSPREWGASCRFASRCAEVLPRCRAEQPPMFALGPGRSAACFLHAPESQP